MSRIQRKMATEVVGLKEEAFLELSLIKKKKREPQAIATINRRSASDSLGFWGNLLHTPPLRDGSSRLGSIAWGFEKQIEAISILLLGHPSSRCEIRSRGE